MNTVRAVKATRSPPPTMEKAMAYAVSLKFIWVLSSQLAVKESKGSFELTVRPRLHMTKDFSLNLGCLVFGQSPGKG